MKLVVISGGVSDPSSTGMLAERLAQSARARARERGREVTVEVIELRALANEIAAGLVSGLEGAKLQTAAVALREADAIIAATPVYKAGVSGLFKSFVDLLDNDLLIAKPVLLAATAGTARHALARRRGDAVAVRLPAGAHRAHRRVRRLRGLGFDRARRTHRARRPGAGRARRQRRRS